MIEWMVGLIVSLVCVGVLIELILVGTVVCLAGVLGMVYLIDEARKEVKKDG